MLNNEIKKSEGLKKQRDGDGVNLWLKQIAIVLGLVLFRLSGTVLP
jgi:hypothetical protein